MIHFGSARPNWRLLVLLIPITTLLLLPALAGRATAPLVLGPASGPVVLGGEVASPPLAGPATVDPLTRLDPALTSIATSSEPDRMEYVVVRSAGPVDLGAFSANVHAFRWPAGENLAVLSVRAGDLLKIAALPGVASVAWGDPEQVREVPAPPDPDLVRAYRPLDAATMRARLAAAPSWAETADRIASEAVGRGKSGTAAGSAGNIDAGATAELAGSSEPATAPDAAEHAAAPQAWFDIGKGHAASEAWALGYTGEGVRVAVLDTGVDFGHQDMQGTWAVLPPGHPYAGWPQAYDPIGAYRYMLDVTDGRDYSRTANGSLIELYQESDVVEQEVGGQLVDTACLRPLSAANNSGGGARSLLDPDCKFVVPESKSGRVRFGHHPDRVLFSLRVNTDTDPPARGEFAGVLLVDANEPGVYDTLYVDLDADHDFTNEKPVTKDSPLSWRDIDGDAIADLSGGLLYYFADGTLPIPGAYLWGIEDRVPTAGAVVGLFYDSGEHGTLCASNVVSQGRLGVPPEVSLSFRDLPGDGRPLPLSPGMAPGARMVGVGNVYSGPSVVMESAWRYGFFGHDPQRSDDDIQITSNSYGYSGDDNDGWDPSSRYVDYYLRHFSPSTSVLMATGNGAPGYGTIAPPSPASGINVAASTQMGSTGWDSIFEAGQITFGDVTPWSNRGPTADGHNGPHVAASGAYAGGGVPINTITTDESLPENRRSGEYANVTWGGTSRATPVAAGNLALVYQAFRAANGRWPTWQEARSILMAGARYAAYDTFVMGAGIIDAADSVRIAAGLHGVHALPSEWTAGSYRGAVYPAFAKLLQPGQAVTTAITLRNPSDHAIEVALQGQWLRRIGGYEDSLETTDVAAESRYNFHAPDYVKLIDLARIPTDTELMIVRGIYPLAEADTNVSEADRDGDLVVDNNWRMGVWQHTDWNDNQELWRDEDGNGTVGRVDRPGRYRGVDRSGWQLDIDWAKSEIDEGEYERFSYQSGTSNNWAIPVHHPLERWRDGIYLGMWHRTVTGTVNNETVLVGRTAAVPRTHFRFRVDFYRYQDWPWLSASPSSVNVPAGGEASFEATMAVPAAAQYGAYQGALFADYDRGTGDRPVDGFGGYEIGGQRVVIPVNANVAAPYDWRGAITFGRPASDPMAPYDNGVVRGAFDWSWRPESGDWRFFFVDAGIPRGDTFWLLRTTWDDDNVGQSDIDTRFWGPAPDRFTDPSHPDNAADPTDPDAAAADLSDSTWFGPHGLALVTRSPYRVLGWSGRWPFDTSSGANEDWLAAPARTGLHEVMLQNGLFSGTQFEMSYETTVSAVRVVPPLVNMTATECGVVEITPQMDLPGFITRSFGPRQPEVFLAATIGQDTPDDPATAGFKHDVQVTTTAARFEVTLAGPSDHDLDLYVLRDADGNGQFDYDREVVGRSASLGSDERVVLAGFQPAGTYQVWVHGRNVEAAAVEFDLTIDAVFGEGLAFRDVPTTLAAGEAHRLELCVDPDSLGDGSGPFHGVVVFGPGGAPNLLSLPVRLTRLAERFEVQLPLAITDWDLRADGGLR